MPPFAAFPAIHRAHVIPLESLNAMEQSAAPIPFDPAEILPTPVTGSCESGRVTRAKMLTARQRARRAIDKVELAGSRLDNADAVDAHRS